MHSNGSLPSFGRHLDASTTPTFPFGLLFCLCPYAAGVLQVEHSGFVQRPFTETSCVVHGEGVETLL